jgi:hypothetical protein
MEAKLSETELEQVDSAIKKAIDQYIESRRAKIAEFVNKHFSVKGAMRIHKKALGSDLYKGPMNISWSVPYIILKATSALFKKIGSKKIPALFEKLPRGFETNVQKEVKWLIYTELLEIPYAEAKRKSDKDALLEEIFNQPEISALFIEQLSAINQKSSDPKFRRRLEENLWEYASSRTAAADLAGAIITLSVGATLFKQMTPGAMVTGTAVATAIAQQTAVSNFVLGSTLGSLWYSIFPVSASVGLIVATTGTIMAAMSLLTSFVGIVTDPIQTRLGIHQRRLRKFIDCIEKELKGTGDSKFEIKDLYVARVFDILDILKTAASTVLR